MSKELKSVQETICENAQAFIDVLNPMDDRWRPSQKRWGSEFDNPWIFRGHQDASWYLQPKAWRDDGQKNLTPIINRIEPILKSSWNELKARPSFRQNEKTYPYILQTAAEEEVVWQFANLADELGFPIPNSEHFQLTNASNFIKHIDNYFPDFGVNTIFGLAQHHGIPTRLLDWTRNPWVAAFFSAESFMSPRDNIAVWALSLSFIERFQRLRILKCPRSQHDFLHAQDALFLWDRQATRYFLDNGKWPKFEDLIEEKFNKGYQNGDEKPLIKIILHADSVHEVLKKLWRQRISRAHLMPNFDNITQALKSKWYWSLKN